MFGNVRYQFLIGLSLSVCVLATPNESKGVPRGYAIEHVTVIDVEGARRRPDCTVLIEGTSIQKIGPASEVVVPEGFERVQGKDKFLIPGLFDAHVHYAADPATYGPLCIAHGVTFVRDLGPIPNQSSSFATNSTAGRRSARR